MDMDIFKQLGCQFSEEKSNKNKFRYKTHKNKQIEYVIQLRQPTVLAQRMPSEQAISIHNDIEWCVAAPPSLQRKRKTTKTKTKTKQN